MLIWLMVATALGQSCMPDINQMIEESSTEALKALYYSGRDFDESWQV